MCIRDRTCTFSFPWPLDLRWAALDLNDSSFCSFCSWENKPSNKRWLVTVRLKLTTWEAFEWRQKFGGQNVWPRVYLSRLQFQVQRKTARCEFFKSSIDAKESPQPCCWLSPSDFLSLHSMVWLLCSLNCAPRYQDNRVQCRDSFNFYLLILIAPPV